MFQKDSVMKAFVFIAYCWLCGLPGSLALADGNFIFTSPKVIDAGTTAHFTLTVFHSLGGGTANLQVLSANEDEVYAKSLIAVISNKTMDIKVTIPPISSGVTAKLELEGSFGNGYKIQATKDVRIRHNTVLTFVQTDKPLYKPGQTIRFRVLPMDNELKTLDANTVGDVWIEDPSNTRIAQWKEVKFTEGLKQFELLLSEEPPLGIWTIKTEINKVLSSQTFKVEKYVLPRFEVTIKAPSVVMANAENISIEICAKYTYGKKVDGTLKLEIKREIHQRRQNSPVPSIVHSDHISGCYEFAVNMDNLTLENRQYHDLPLKIYAEVTEDRTDIVRNATANSKVSRDALLLSFVRNNEYYKQRLPFYGFLQVSKPDGSPAASEETEICATFNYDENIYKGCHIFTSDTTGMIKFSIAPTAAKKIQLKATAIKYEKGTNFGPWVISNLKVPRAQMELRPWYSPSNSYLQIDSTIDELQCDKLQHVKVLYTAKEGSTITFYYQVLSKGRIVQQGFHQTTFHPKGEKFQYDLSEGQGNLTDKDSTPQGTGEFILSFNTSATMSPKARLLIFYVREDKEIVADSRMFQIKKCLTNKVDLKFRHEQQYPSTEAVMILSASPSSLCGITMVDKSVRLLEKDTTFNKDTVFNVLEEYDVGKNDPPQQTTHNYCHWSPDHYGSYGTRWSDNGNSPRRRGRDTRPPRGFSRFDFYGDAVMAFEEAGMIVVTDLKLNTRPCIPPPVLPRRRVYYKARVPMTFTSASRPDIYSSEDDFPKSVEVPKSEEVPKSVEEIRSYFPETWLWELIPVGSSGEEAIKRQIPDTITEWKGGAICVHPKAGLGISDSASLTAFQPFFVDFQLPYSVIRGEVLTVAISVFNYLSECLPIKFSLEPSEEYELLTHSRHIKGCVCGSQSVTKRFQIRPVTLGQVNITMYVFSITDDDEVCGNEVTAKLNARDAVTKQLLVEAEGFPKEEVFNYFICPKNTNGSYTTEVDLLLPENVIDGSARAYMTMTGDIMGPALNGLKNLVRLPVGCGEQNMILFAPNIFVMDYLSATEKLTETIKEECLNNMKTGYQRELQYRHKDGSYSAFGSKDKEGSLWLTAFVLKSFGQAKRFISIDEKDFSQSTSWIQAQQLENGCFKPSGSIIHKEMKGGLQDSGKTFAPLTAFVLISLLESSAEKHDHLVITKGLKCLEAEASPTNYALSLFAYASSLAKEIPMARKYLKQLNEKAITDGNKMFWNSSSSSKSISIETAGYYILGSLETGSSSELAGIVPVVRWLTQQRNSYGGFVSTQDTIVALQSLAKYASKSSNQLLDMQLSVESEELNHSFTVDEKNKLLTQSIKIPVVPAIVDLQAAGEGCALVQFSLRYNVEQVLTSETFDLNITAERLKKNNCDLPRLNICMRYRILGEASNMVVLSAKMVSGFLPDEWSLSKLENDPKVQLKRHDIKENEVNFYFDQLTNDQKCLEFFLKTEFDIIGAKPSIIKLYDYYQPEFQVSEEYSIPYECDKTDLAHDDDEIKGTKLLSESPTEPAADNCGTAETTSLTQSTKKLADDTTISPDESTN